MRHENGLDGVSFSGVVVVKQSDNFYEKSEKVMLFHFIV